MGAETLAVEIKLSDAAFKTGLTRLSASFDKSISGMLGGMTGKLIAVGGALAAAFASKKVLEAAARQEDAVNRLNSALIATGKFSEATSNSLQQFASSLQAVTRYGDEAILEAQGLMQSLGRLDEKGLKTATVAATDLAAALKMDLNSAAQLVGKAAAGNVTALTKWGLTIKKGSTDAETFANAMAAIQKNFGGAAQRDVNTFSGRLDQLKNAFGDTQEQIGMMITKSPTLVAMIKGLGEWFSRASKSMENFGKGRDVIKDIADTLIQIGKALTLNVGPPLELAYNIGRLFVNALLTGLTGIALAAVKFRKFWYENVEGPITEFLLGTAGKVLGYFDKDLGASIENWAKQSAEFTTKAYNVAEDFLEQKLPGLTESTNSAMAGMFDFSATDATEKFVNSAGEWLNQVKPPVHETGKDLGRTLAGGVLQGAQEAWPNWDDFVGGWTSATKTMADRTKDLGRQMRQTLELGVVNSLSAVGEALVKGENGFAAFGKAMLGVFGDLAIQTGAFYLLLGLGNLFLNPAAAAAQIAAGTALIVLGGALKAFAGGGGQSAGATASSPTGSQGGGVIVDATPEDYETPQARERGTAIHINVQGNILDRRGTGLELAEALNEVWGTNGVVVAGAS